MKRDFDDMRQGSIELFCLAVEQSSFTGAANVAGITPAAVSRSIGRLEERLGVRLFVRTTRQIRLTEGGVRYYDKCRSALLQLVDAEREVTGAQAAPAGALRISAPTPFAHYRLLPLLPKFRKLYPDVTVEVHVSNRNIDFAGESYDIAIRGRDPADSSLVARKLEDAELVLVAAPAYLRHAGAPVSLDALQGHECIQFDLPSTGRKIAWVFHVDGKPVDVVTHGGYTCSEDVLGIVTLARSGAGIVQTYRYIVEQDLKTGGLVELLPQHGGTSRPFILLYPHARHLSLRVRAFVDFLVEQLGGGRALRP